MMLKNHIGTSANHLGSSWVTFIFPPRAARRLTVTPSQQNFHLHTSISRHHLVLISSLTHQGIALAEICPMAPCPQRSPLLHQLTSRFWVRPLFLLYHAYPRGSRRPRPRPLSTFRHLRHPTPLLGRPQTDARVANTCPNQSRTRE